MWSFPSTSRYERVGQDADELKEDDFKPPKSTSNGSLNAALWVAVLGLILSITFSAIGTATKTSISMTKTAAAGGPLRRPNQYLGLERINYAKEPAFKDIELLTFANVIQPIDSTHPARVYDKSLDPNPRNDDWESHFLVSNTISTIVQFRVRDWSMEICQLVLNLPKSAEHLPVPSVSNGVERSRDWILEGDVSGLEVWVLSTSSLSTGGWIEPTTLSWNTKPKRSHLLSTMDATLNTTTHSLPFRCVSDSIQSFELMCTTPNCRIDVWQDKVRPLVGLALKQTSSFEKDV